MKLKLDHIEWGGPDGDWYFIYWWDWREKGDRYFGPFDTWYDGPIRSFGLWFTVIQWNTPWTRGRKPFEANFRDPRITDNE